MKLISNIYFVLFAIIVVSLWSPANCGNTSKDYTSFKRYILCKTDQDVRHPKTIEEVCDIVKEANIKGLRVKAFGVRHSQSDIICTDGIPVDMTGIQYVRLNDDNTVAIGAGTTMINATEEMRKYNRGLRVIPAFANITAGGAIGAGAHGSSVKYHAALSSQVVKMKIVNAKGIIEEITDPEDLKAFKVHLGLLGIVVEVTFITVEMYKCRAHNYIASDDILTDGRALQMVKNADQLAFYWFPAMKEVVVCNFTFVRVETPGTCITKDQSPALYTHFAHILNMLKEITSVLTYSSCAAAKKLGYSILNVIEYYSELVLVLNLPDQVPIYSTAEGKFQNPAVGYYNRMISTTCADKPTGILGEACTWSHGDASFTYLDIEFGLKMSKLPDFVRAVRAILKNTPTSFPLQGIYIRFADKSDIYMSTAYGQQTVYVEFNFWHRDDIYNDPMVSLAGYQTILQKLTTEFGARSHWGKSGSVYHNSKYLDLKLDETARQKFIGIMNKYDPNGVFMNSFGRRLKRIGEEVDIDPLTTHCALVDNCICSKNSHCASTQKCSNIRGYDYLTCQSKTKSPKYVFDRRSLPSPRDIMPYFLSEVPDRVDDVISKCSWHVGATERSMLKNIGTLTNELREYRLKRHVLLKKAGSIFEPLYKY